MAQQDNSSKSRSLKSTKTFKPQESPFSVLFNTSDSFNAIYGYIGANIFFIILTVFIGYLTNETSWQIDKAYLSRQFGKLSYVVACDVILHLICYTMIYPSGAYVNNLTIKVATSFAALSSMVLIPIITALKFDLSFVLTFALTLEQTRLIMKSISFLVECQHILHPTSSSDIKLAQLNGKDENSSSSNNNNNSNNNDDGSRMEKEKNYYDDEPTINNFTYFLFAPTLIYRPNYPRTSKPTNWWKVFRWLLEMVILAILGLQFVTKKAIPTLSTIGLIPMSVNDVWINILFSACAGTLSFIALAYGFLHCWLNIWAEILQFADRGFYREWWLADSFSSFWSKWNTLIHAWISEYLFKPLVHWTKSYKMSMIITFIISALVHEYITGFSLGFWYPLFALTMLLPVPLILTINKSSSTLSGAVFNQHCAFIFCFASMYFLYSIEYYARINCPARSSLIMDLMIPRSMSCVKIV